MVIEIPLASVRRLTEHISLHKPGPFGFRCDRQQFVINDDNRVCVEL